MVTDFPIADWPEIAGHCLYLALLALAVITLWRAVASAYRREQFLRMLDRVRADRDRAHHAQSIATPDADAIGRASVTTWSDHTKESVS